MSVATVAVLFGTGNRLVENITHPFSLGIGYSFVDGYVPKMHAR
jgi:hypothetical protein